MFGRPTQGAIASNARRQSQRSCKLGLRYEYESWSCFNSANFWKKKQQTLGAMEESTKWVAARELSHRGLGQPHDAALPSESDTAVLGVYFEKITSLELPKVLAENTNKVTLRFFKSRLHLRNNTL